MTFSEAIAFPSRPRCIGVVLQPFSLGHKLLLQATGSAFVDGDRFPIYEDLIAAAFICAHTWEENQRLLRSPLRRWLLLKVWGRLAGKFNITDALLVMSQYVREADEFPRVKMATGPGVREVASEFDTRLYAVLRGIGMSEGEALNIPLQVAYKLFAHHLEDTGKNEFVTPGQQAMEDRMTQLCEEAEQEEQSRAV